MHAVDEIAVAVAPFIERVEVYAVLTPLEVANMLAVSLKTLERWRGIGEGPSFVKLSISTVRYRAVDVNEFIEASLHNNTAQ